MKKIFLETFGCQMNVLDSELVENQLRSLGYAFTADSDAADVVLYNTCSVRELSEQKVLSRLGRMKIRKKNEPDVVVGVIGCMAERDGIGMLQRLPHVDLLCGPSELDKLPALLENALLTGKQQHALAGNTARRSATLQSAEEDGLELLDLSRSFSATEQKYQAYIRIVRGCNKFCTYCVVPYTRGPEVSRTPEAIVAEARKLVDAGCLEITLLGQTVNHYVHEETVSTPTGPALRRTTFAELLAMVHDRVPELPRLRFVTSFPADFGDDILHVMASSPRICRYLHIPAQSGSNRILKMMNRGYTAESYLELIDRAKKIVPGIALAGDIIVGFPTETDEDYAATRALVEQVRYKNCFIFKYSPRPGTLAIKRYEDDVPDPVKRYRNNDLLHRQNQISEELNQQLPGTVVSVLCEGPSGWDAERDSVVAGARGTPEHAHAGHSHDGHSQGEACGTSSGGGAVELGSRLAAAMGAAPAAAVNVLEAGRTQRKAVQRSARADLVREPGWIQLTGRTPADQIVVFNGPADWQGRILPVRVKSAHGLTIFGDVEKSTG